MTPKPKQSMTASKSQADDERRPEEPRWRLPRLRGESDSERERHANWLELFFDLVFVVAITELSHTLAAHLTLTGLWQFVLLFIPCWWAWTLVTFYIDRFDADDVKHRLLILAAMLSILFLATNVHNVFAVNGTASRNGATNFALAYITTRTIVLLLYVRAARHVPIARISLNVYLTSYLPTAICWLCSLVFAAPTRFMLWAIAIAIELAVPIIKARHLASTPVHPSHLPERFGLLTLIVLGESVVSVAQTTTGGSGGLLGTIAAVMGFAIAACLWWLYFDFLEAVVVVRSIRSAHIYNYGHLPLIMGLALVAVGTKETIQEANHAVLSDGARMALCGGVALFSLALYAIWALACSRNFAWGKLGWIGLTIAIGLWGRPLSPMSIAGLLLALLIVRVNIRIFRNNISDRTTVVTGDRETEDE